jgi:lipopolysaccharide/colanic/teichoic acid biosynthesis glycosyltransferase
MPLMSLQLLDRENDQTELLCVAVKRADFQKGFYALHGKRALDILSSALSLIALSPFLIFVACCVRFTSRGPVVFRQIRAGKDGRQFQILKFRSMVVDAAKEGSRITIAGDRRVTVVGKFLRAYKIDELPQLWNVLRGDMSLVGPRPELPVYVAEYTPEQRLVLSVRPGITDPASLAYRHEEKILAGHRNPEQFYRTQILPDKLARNLAYLREISFSNDLRIILATVASSFVNRVKDNR